MYYLPSLRNHAAHILSTTIIRQSKMNILALSYIGPKIYSVLVIVILFI